MILGNLDTALRDVYKKKYLITAELLLGTQILLG